MELDVIHFNMKVVPYWTELLDSYFMEVLTLQMMTTNDIIKLYNIA